VRKVLQRQGTLLQGAAALVEVLCVDVRRTTLVLTPLTKAESPLAVERACRFQFTDGSGLFQISGSLDGTDRVTVNGVTHHVLLFKAEDASPVHLNRRESFRVSVSLKGELAVFRSDELRALQTNEEPVREILTSSPGRLEELYRLVKDRKRPCVLLDISLGGARVALPPPAPRIGQVAFMDIALGPGDVLLNISGSVVQGINGRGRGEFRAQARLRFDALSGKTEARLAKLINKVQVENLRQGVRDRR